MTITLDLLGAGPPCRLAERDMVIVGRLGVAVCPGRVGVDAEPVRCSDGQGIQRRPQRLEGATQPVD